MQKNINGRRKTKIKLFFFYLNFLPQFYNYSPPSPDPDYSHMVQGQIIQLHLIPSWTLAYIHIVQETNTKYIHHFIHNSFQLLCPCMVPISVEAEKSNPSKHFVTGITFKVLLHTLFVALIIFSKSD